MSNDAILHANKRKRGKNVEPALQVITERYILIAVDKTTSDVKTMLSERNIPFKEISIYSMEDEE